MFAMVGGETTFHNDPLLPSEIRLELSRAWVGVFGSTLGLASAAIASVLGLTLAVWSRTTRKHATGLALLWVLALGTVFVGMRSGAAEVKQTPYWVVASCLSFAAIALGWATENRFGKAMLGLLIAVWLVSSVTFQMETGGLEGRSDSQTAAALRNHLSMTMDPDDVVVYLWETPFLNDKPLERDALFSAFEPGELRDWTGRELPCRNYGFHWADAIACFRASTGMRGGEHEEALGADLEAWLAQGRGVHLVRAAVDAKRAPPDPSRLKARVAELGGSWHEARPGGLRVDRIKPPAD